MRYLYLILILFTGTLVSCVDNTTEGVSAITYYPIITINGSSNLILEQGADYTDEGAIATEGDTEIPVTVEVSGGTYFGLPLNTDNPDSYTITYSAVNGDGFAGSAIRDILVIPSTGDLINSIEGLYTAEVSRGSESHTDLEYIMIKKIGENEYAISNANAGFYSLGRGYGTPYAALGATIIVNDIATNDFNYTPGFIAPFGLTITLSGMQVDAVNKTISFTNQYNTTTGIFNAILTQVEL